MEHTLPFLPPAHRLQRLVFGTSHTLGNPPQRVIELIDDTVEVPTSRSHSHHAENKSS